MILDDKTRVIGKIVSINSDRFTVELLSGTKNFNVSGYDDIHYFAQINSYVIVPYQNDYIVSEVISVREKDTGDFSSAKEQELSKAQSIKHLDVLPIGNIRGKEFSFGVSVYPTLYSDVLYVKDEELDAIFEVASREKPVCLQCEDSKECTIHVTSQKGQTRLTALDVGSSAIFPDYDIKIDIDKFFGSHSAVLGNTGSGKSCTIASMMQTLFSKEKYSANGSTFIIFDVNGEYTHALAQLPNKDINVKTRSINAKDEGNRFLLPHYYLNVEEWALLLKASDRTQLPILRNALGLATLFSNKGSEVEKVKNHVLASCILETFNTGDSPVSKYQKIQSLIIRGSFPNDIAKDYDQKYGNFTSDTAEKLFLDTVKASLITDAFEIPAYDNSKFDFAQMGECLDIAILYEESHGNKQIRDYCSSLITRFKSIREREEFLFLKTTDDKTADLEEFVMNTLGLKKIKNDSKKEYQVIIIDLNAIEDEVVELISSVTTRLIFNQLRNIPDELRNTFPVNLVLEEAHRYISSEAKGSYIRANQIFERVAKEGRKYGLFFLISSQRPSELSRTVLSQCNNFIVHRIQNPDDLSHIRQITPHISEATLKKLPSIPTQHALIFGSSVNVPTLYKVKDANPLPLSDNNKVSENWFIDKDQTIAALIK